MTSNLRPRTFLLYVLATHLGAAFATQAVAATPKYKLTEINSPTYPSQITFCVDVNDSGVVLTHVVERGWLKWQDGQVVHEEIAFDASPLRINNRGDVTGTRSTDAVVSKGFLFTSLGVEVALQDMPGGQDVNHPDGLNNLGEIYGESLGDVDGRANASVPVRWNREGAVERLAVPLGANDFFDVYDANDSGLVVGTRRVGLGIGPGQQYGWSWQAGQYITLPLNHAQAVNNLGEIVGSIFDGPNAGGVVWSGGDLRPLLPLANGASSGPMDVNDSGISVGAAFLGADSYAAMWSHDGASTMLSEVTTGARDWKLQRATAINNNGLIVGYGVNPRGVIRGFVLTPLVPEPQTSALALLFLAYTLVSSLKTRADLPKAGLKTGG